MTKETISAMIWFISSLLIFPSCIATRHDVLALNRQIQTLSAQLYKLEGVREKQADVGVELDSIREELQRMSGALEENQHLVKNVVERDTLEQDTLNARLATLEKKVAYLYKHMPLEPQPGPRKPTEETAPPQAGRVTPQPPAPDTTAAEPEKTLYEENLETYRAGRYEDAIAGFKKMIQIYPESSLADNAQFWIGESYMALKKYEQAIRAYHDVITKYPKGNKVPNAMLKQAMAFIEAKDNVAAKIVLKNLIKQYPNSEETKLAEAKLKTIK